MGVSDNMEMSVALWSTGCDRQGSFTFLLAARGWMAHIIVVVCIYIYMPSDASHRLTDLWCYCRGLSLASWPRSTIPGIRFAGGNILYAITRRGVQRTLLPSLYFTPWTDMAMNFGIGMKRPIDFVTAHAQNVTFWTPGPLWPGMSPTTGSPPGPQTARCATP